MSYLPMDCPVCGRRRLIPEFATSQGRTFVPSVECEKCGARWPDHDDLAPSDDATGSADPMACAHLSGDGDLCDLQSRKSPAHGGLHSGVRYGTRIFWNEDGDLMEYSERALRRAARPSPNAALPAERGSGD